MTEKKIQAVKNPHSAAVPTIFADQPAMIQSGPYTTKITLGNIEEDESDFPVPVVTLIMPTVNLIRMVNDLHKMVNSADFSKQSRSIIESDIATYFSKAASTQLAPKRIKQNNPG